MIIWFPEEEIYAQDEESRLIRIGHDSRSCLVLVTLTWEDTGSEELGFLDVKREREFPHSNTLEEVFSTDGWRPWEQITELYELLIETGDISVLKLSEAL